MTIHISTEEMEQGSHFPHSCPLATAIKEKTGARTCRVTVQGVWIFGQEVSLPLEAVRWLKRYDARQPVPPLTFELVIPSREDLDELED